MYNLPYYKEQDQQKVLQFVKDNPFAFICGCDAQLKPVATQVPVFIDEQDGKLILSGHMMKATDHYKAFSQNPNILAVFTGPHTYVSASWYENKQQGSTWNYMSVHAKGTLTFQDEATLIEILKRTTNHFENNPYSGANFDDLPEEYVQRMVKAISGFKVEVETLEHVFKLSQNRDEKSYDTIVDKLEQKGGESKQISDLMRARKGEVFK